MTPLMQTIPISVVLKQEAFWNQEYALILASGIDTDTLAAHALTLPQQPQRQRTEHKYQMPPRAISPPTITVTRSRPSAVATNSNDAASSITRSSLLDLPIRYDDDHVPASPGYDTIREVISPRPTVQSPTTAGGTNPVFLERLRRITGFESQAPFKLFEAFRKGTESASSNDIVESLTLPEFLQCFAPFVPTDTASSFRAGMEALDDVFSLFDNDGNGVVDCREFSNGLQLLCGSDESEKLRVAFAAYDQDGDGSISLSEMEDYFVSFFRAFFALSGEMQNQSISVEELGRATAAECFEKADTNNDGRVTFEEFVAWSIQSKSE
jgi:Ca2+-binding EF-hand superfamily protein